MSQANHHISQAADAIIALINSKPQSPTKDELAAVIGKALAAPTAARDTYLKSDWPRALSAYLDEVNQPGMEDDDDYLGALDDRLRDAAMAICAMPVRTMDDLIVRAAMSVYWNRGSLSDPAYPDHILISGGCDERPLAAVVRGVLDLAGLKFDAEGRLLGVTSALDKRLGASGGAIP